MKHIGTIPLVVCGLAALASAPLTAQARTAERSTFEVYGFAMMDMGYSTKQNDPAWFDVIRTTKLPSVAGQFGGDGRAYFSARQTRLGVRSSTPTSLGPLKTTFEFEMFGTGVDAGQTTIRLRHAYGELGKFGAGQYWSPFMDIDVFPNTVEYWGPAGMAFFRNVQFRFMPIQGDTRFTIALERPGASGDAGIYSDRIELADISPRFPLPDLSAEYRIGRPWGYVEVAGIVRSIVWDDLGNVAGDVSGDATGWGLSVSSNIKAGKQNVVRLQLVYGAGIENYMNDAPADVGTVNDPAVIAEALPVLGVVAFLDHTWNDRFSTAIGYSMVSIENSEGQAPDAFHVGHYAAANLMFYPARNVMLGGELQFGQRENNSDGFTSSDFRIQFSFKYNFAKQL